VPLFASPYLLTGILIPLLILSAALGQHLTGYAGCCRWAPPRSWRWATRRLQLTLRVPGMPVLVAFAGGGLVAALVGVLFGLPSLRIRGFYLAVATLAAQFFILWFLTKVGWVTNYSASASSPPSRSSSLLRVHDAAGKISAGAVDRVADGAGGEEDGARRRRPHLDGRTRHGRRRGGYRHPADAGEAARFCGEPFYQKWPGAVRLRVSGNGRLEAFNPDLPFWSCSW
jgi:hypothetical protein